MTSYFASSRRFILPFAGESKGTGKENTLTAKVERGTLKVKILRQDQKPVANVVDAVASTTSTKTRKRRATRQPPLVSDSPPRPRPNRKHVPIFYGPQFRQLRKPKGSLSSSMEDSMMTYAASSTEASAASEMANSKSSTAWKSGSQLSDVRLYSASGEDVDISPKMNQLLVRNDTEGPEVLSELLRSYFPSSGSSGLYSRPVGGAQAAETSLSSAGQLEDQTIGLTSALHQLASSSALYRSSLNESSTGLRLEPSTLSSASKHATASNILASSTTATTLAKTSDTTHSRTNEGMENYRFDPLSALQTAIDHARRASSASQSISQQNDKHRGIDSSARVYRLEPSGIYPTTYNNENTWTETRLGAVPDFSPSLTVQNSLLGGGIQHPTHLKLPVYVDGNNVSDIADSTNTPATALEPPPDAPPSFLHQNSLTGESFSVLDLLRTHPSLDRPGSLSNLINQRNETAKEDLNSASKSGSKTHLNLDRLVSITSLASEDSGSGKSVSMTAACHSASTSDTSVAFSNTIQDTVSIGAVDLGPPPSGPPAFTIGNSLIGGGIELQPAAANVNTHNFDWKLHRAVSNTSEDVTFSSEISREISYALRARLERSLISFENTPDKA